MNNTLSKTLLAALIALTGSPAQSQIYKGATFIGGNLGMSQRSVQVNSVGYNDNSYFSAFVNPKAGCYVTKNLAIGLSLHFGFSNGENTQPNPMYGYYGPIHTSQRTYAAGGSVFARYTKFIIPKLAFFTEGSIGYRHTRDEVETNYYPMYETSGGRGNGFNVSIVPGIMFMATPRLGFEVSYGNLGYGYMRYKQDNAGFGPAIPAPVSTVSEFGFDLTSSTISLGFNYYFGNRPRIKVQEADDE
jgi:hypothetical protein